MFLKSLGQRQYRFLVLALLLSILLSGCEGMPGAAERAVNAPCGAVTAGPLPAGFPKSFPLPPGAAITSRETRSADRIIVETIVPGDVKSVAVFFERALPQAGFTPGKGESEPSEAEASWSGNGYRGRWKANSIVNCPDKVSLTILAQPQ